ncbi:MAG: glycosyltransferase, partial [Actinomycetota bacterium]|nr:glycosyltransferase [Actinomycetota bacterium]
MIPCFNSAAFLVRALESVLAQDEGPDAMQIEVVDDASTNDDAAQAVNRVGRGRVGYFRQANNVGAAANFTTCVRRSAGEWVHILHSDDVVLPGFYQRYRRRIEACPDAVMVAAQSILTDADERWVAVTPPVDTAGGYMSDAAFTIASELPIQCVAVVVARSAYERLGGFHPLLFHANDWEMWARVAGDGPVAWVDVPMGLYRSHPDSDSTRLYRSTAYLDDCTAAVDVITERFGEPDRRAAVRAAGR